MKLEIIHNGSTLPQVVHEGVPFFVVPEKGEFQIKLTNDSIYRRLAVLTVDGVNVIDGSDGSVNGRGYVLEGWSSTTIKGWKRGDKKAASFRFTNPDGGYTTLMGKGKDNQSYIGLAVYREIYQPTIPWSLDFPYPSPWRKDTLPKPWDWWNVPRIWCGVDVSTNCATSTSSTPRSISSSSRGVESSIATGYGKEVDFSTTTVEFRRDPSSRTTEVYRYATEEDLRAVGALPENPAFPADQGVPAPPDWCG